VVLRGEKKGKSRHFSGGRNGQKKRKTKGKKQSNHNKKKKKRKGGHVSITFRRKKKNKIGGQREGESPFFPGKERKNNGSLINSIAKKK